MKPMDPFRPDWPDPLNRSIPTEGRKLNKLSVQRPCRDKPVNDIIQEQGCHFNGPSAPQKDKVFDAAEYLWYKRRKS